MIVSVKTSEINCLKREFVIFFVKDVFWSIPRKSLMKIKINVKVVYKKNLICELTY